MSIGDTSSRRTYTNLEPLPFLEFIGHTEVVILDVRTPLEFDEGHLPGALNVDVQDPAFVSVVSQFNKQDSFALYCRAGRRSQAAAQFMIDQGFTSVTNSTSGIADLQSAGGVIVIS